MAKWSEVWKDESISKWMKPKVVKSLAFNDGNALDPKTKDYSKAQYPHTQGFQIRKKSAIS